VQAQVKLAEKAAKEGRKLSQHEKEVSTLAVNTGWRNMESSLCNFFSFWQILDGTMFVVVVCVCVCVCLPLTHIDTNTHRQ